MLFIHCKLFLSTLCFGRKVTAFLRELQSLFVGILNGMAY
ncbi:hypothetical protein HMPREF9445_02589 [Bacteroides clarus YIT 12056]|uniref:Uncharacterized protein n=1 Tax=Bacteroides clarus YIT 12056 TaxID=762984 RepID=A0ABN0CLE7_9BACE|nr:hypothetical protein HMPREF9445_02589 [Bacteroides clarus YIT 12056]